MEKAPINTPKVPTNLTERSQEMWRQVVPSRARSAERLLLIQVALETLDRLAEVQETLKAEGLMVTNKSTGTRKPHPLLKVERELRQQFAKIWSSDLSFAWNGSIDGRVR